MPRPEPHRHPPVPLPPDIAARLPNDLLGADPADVVSAVAALSVNERARLLQDVTAVLTDARMAANVGTRIVAVRLLIALLPDSLDTITGLLRRRDGVLDYEVHFTLFCYLDWVSVVEAPAGVAADVLALVAEYLHDVPSDSARAAWMAGDMLGDHWAPLDDALPVLINAVVNARFVAGRAGALSGLEQTIENLGTEDSRTAEIISVLRFVRSNDRSRKLRRSADLLLDHANTAAPDEPVSGQSAGE
jgi:hypothetical protein